MTQIRTIEVHCEGSDLIKLVGIMRQDINGHVTMASIRDPRTPISVVVQRSQDGDWEPLYGLKNENPIILPHCFALNAATLAALDMAVSPLHMT